MTPHSNIRLASWPDQTIARIHEETQREEREVSAHVMNATSIALWAIRVLISFSAGLALGALSWSDSPWRGVAWLPAVFAVCVIWRFTDAALSGTRATGSSGQPAMTTEDSASRGASEAASVNTARALKHLQPIK